MSAPSPQSDGNRKDPRARVLNMTVRYRSATVDEFIENHSHDISRGGMFIKTRSPFPAGTLLKFEVRIAEDQKLMHGVGRVVWRREPQDDTQEPPSGMGIKFIKTGEGAAALIGQLVNARKGKESNFDAGIRTHGDEEPSSLEQISAKELRANDLPIDSSRATLPPPESTIYSSDESSQETEILVSSPPKARINHTPERRKVVLKDEPPSETAKTPVQLASTPPATLPPRAQRAPESAHGAAVSPKVAQAALAAAEAKKPGPSTGSVFAIIAVAAAAWLVLKPGSKNPPAPEQLTPPAAVAHEKAPAKKPSNSRANSPTGNLQGTVTSAAANSPISAPTDTLTLEATAGQINGTNAQQSSNARTSKVVAPKLTEKAKTAAVGATPTSSAPGATEQTAAMTKPGIARPMSTKPAATKPAVTKPTLTKPAVTKPAITKPTIIKPAITKPPVSRPTVTKPRVAKPKAPVAPKTKAPKVIVAKATLPEKPSVTKPSKPSKPVAKKPEPKPAAPKTSPKPAASADKAPAATAKPAAPAPRDDNPY